jgi:hypothetical protein
MTELHPRPHLLAAVLSTDMLKGGHVEQTCLAGWCSACMSLGGTVTSPLTPTGAAAVPCTARKQWLPRSFVAMHCMQALVMQHCCYQQMYKILAAAHTACGARARCLCVSSVDDAVQFLSMLLWSFSGFEQNSHLLSS